MVLSNQINNNNNNNNNTLTSPAATKFKSNSLPSINLIDSKPYPIQSYPAISKTTQPIVISKIKKHISFNSNSKNIKAKANVCGFKTKYGNYCKSLVSLGLSTCFNHSNGRIICGEKSSKGTPCKQLKGRCIYHLNDSYIPKPRVQCAAIKYNGEQCHFSTNNIYCGLHIPKIVDHCGHITKNG